jgi:hypothetical protein
MSKKLKLLLLGITVVIVGFFIFVLFMGEDDSLYETSDIEEYYWSEDPENYEFEEKGDVTLVKNDNLGFSFEVPSGWEYDKYYEPYGIDPDDERESKGLIFFSPEYNYEEENYSSFPENGCAIGVYIQESYYRDEDGFLYYDADDLRTTIEMIIDEEITRDDDDIVEVDDYYGYFFGDFDEESSIKYIRIPVENKIYEIAGYFSDEEIEKCGKIYRNLLESVSFSKNED